jgi:DNA-binding transcriptional ArsR family regulator
MASVQQIDGETVEPKSEVSEDELFDVLANQRRRFALHLLKREGDETVTIGEMAEQIAAWENGIDMAEITGNERKRVYTALQQSHLPKMDNAGVVEFN